jgi:hypothetical protein
LPPGHRRVEEGRIVGDNILLHHRGRLKQIEEIVRREDIVTLPRREARIRLSTPAETAVQPAPNMRPPPGCPATQAKWVSSSCR